MRWFKKVKAKFSITLLSGSWLVLDISIRSPGYPDICAYCRGICTDLKSFFFHFSSWIFLFLLCALHLWDWLLGVIHAHGVGIVRNAMSYKLIFPFKRLLHNYELWFLDWKLRRVYASSFFATELEAELRVRYRYEGKYRCVFLD